MAELEGQSIAPPVLVNNVETLANVPGIVANGAAWFRSMGTPESPGTVVCTVTGAVQRPCVVEVAMGTALDELLVIAGGVVAGVDIRMLLVGVAGAVVTPDRLSTPLTYEAMASIGSGLGSAGFIVVGTDDDPVAVAAGVSRFLAVESCGQCTACKQDGAEIAQLLSVVAAGNGGSPDRALIQRRLTTVADGARCGLAAQQQVVVGSILQAFEAHVEAQVEPGSAPVGTYVVAPLLGLDVHGAVLDLSVEAKQLDWSTDPVDSGEAPADRMSPRYSISAPSTDEGFAERP
jgi:NADH:ubiquinone oxidoreductase subunit F (NADH-binding)